MLRLGDMKWLKAAVIGLGLLFITTSSVTEAWDNPYPGILAVKQKVKAIGAEHDCDYPSEGWRCQEVQYGTTGYKFEIRYNLAENSPSDHVIFAAGSYFSGLSRDLEGVASIQDTMQAQNVRSYDVQIIGFETITPIPKAPNSSAVLASLVEYISDTYVVGKKVKMITYDYATTLTSYALAYHNLASDVNEVLLLGGPAGFNYKRELYDPWAPSYISAADRMIKVDTWTIIDAIKWINDWKDTPGCDMTYDSSCLGQAELDSASMFSDNDNPFDNVVLSYPTLELHNIIGADDVTWFKDSSKYWYDRVWAKSKTRDVISDVDHFLYSSPEVRKKILFYLGLKDLSAKDVDVVAPTKPAVLKLVDNSIVPGNTLPPHIEITPKGSVDNVGVASYQIYRDGKYIGKAGSSATFRDWSVVAGTTYTYTVKAVDEAGNTSSFSIATPITTAGKAPAGGSPAPNPAVSEKPVIQAAPAYQMEVGKVFAKNDFWITCLDNQDGEIKDDLVVSHNISPIPVKRGDVFTLTIDCIDSDGNVADQKKASLEIVESSVSGNTVGGNANTNLPESGGVDSSPNTVIDSATGLPIVSGSESGNPSQVVTGSENSNVTEGNNVSGVDSSAGGQSGLSGQPGAPKAAPDMSWLYGAAPAKGAVVAGGLVSCGDEGEPKCEFCQAVATIDNVVNWLVRILTTIVTIILMYAGIRMTTSVGNTAAKQAAKSLIYNALIGFAIVLGAWVIIDLLLQSLLVSTNGLTLPWLSNFNCVAFTEKVSTFGG